MENIRIRMAEESDAQALLNIYAPYVKDTAITFEYEVPSVETFRKKIRHIKERYPYLIAEQDGAILGYAYASAFHKRAAYAWAVETSIYLKKEARGNGIGRKLYLILEELLKKQNILNLNACIAFTSTEDPHLDNTSVFFHERLGYKKVGHFTKCGYKFSTWYDIIWMEKLIGEHLGEPKEVVPINETSLHIE